MKKHLLYPMVSLCISLVLLAGCARPAASSSHSIGTESSFSGVSSAVSAAPLEEVDCTIPDAQIAKWVHSISWDGLYLEYYDSSGAPDGVHEVLLPDIDGLSDSFVCDKVMAVVGGSENLAAGAVSHDRGVTWKNFKIPLEMEFIPDKRSFSIGFFTGQNGWFVCQSKLESSTKAAQTALFQTDDGGLNWTLQTVFTIDEAGSKNFFFASSNVGWAVVTSEEGPIYSKLYETFDGGRTWKPAIVDIPQEIVSGLHELFISLPRWVNGHWALSLQISNKVGYSDRHTVDLVWQKLEKKWTWDDPGWNLPDGINTVQFCEYVQFYLYPPPNYDSKIGLGDEPSYWILHDTAEHLARIQGKDFADGIVPYDKIVEMAEILYGDTNFNMEAAAKYWNKMYGLEYTDQGVLYDWVWARWDGAPAIEIQSAMTNTDGSIEAIIKRTEYSQVPQSYVFEEDLVISYSKCTFIPATLDGIQYFTLISTELIDVPTLG